MARDPYLRRTRPDDSEDFHPLYYYYEVFNTYRDYVYQIFQVFLWWSGPEGKIFYLAQIYLFSDDFKDLFSYTSADV